MLNSYLTEQAVAHGIDMQLLEKYPGFFNAISEALDHAEKASPGGEKCKSCAEEAALLKRTQEEVKNLFENIETCFFSIDLQKMKVNQMSVACQKVYGYTQEEFINNLNLWFEVIHPEDKPLLKLHNENLARGIKLHYQYRIIRKDKSIRWTESKVIPTLDNEGNLVRIDGVVDDITDKKEAARKMAKTERLLNEAQKLAGMGSWDCDVARNEIFWSKGLRDIFGINDDFKLDLDALINMVHPDDRELMRKNMLKPDSPERENRITFRIIRKNDGAIRVIYAISRLNTDEENNKRVWGVAHDITEKRAAEEKMLNVEHLLTEAQDLANMGNWNIDMVTNEMFVSDKLRDILEIDKDYRIVVDEFIDLISHPDDKEEIKRVVKNLFENAGSANVVYRIRTVKNKQEKVLHAIMHGQKDSNGKVLRVYGTVQDITERYAAEKKLEQSNMLLYQISHDLRGPINSAKNYIYLAQKRVVDETARNYLHKISDSYSKMEHRVLALLDMQRLNREEVNLETIDMEPLVKGILSSIDGLSGFNDVKIETEIDMPMLFYSDKQFLHSILHNLISNAITHRKNGADARINISALTKDDKIIIKVADNGTGIPENQRSKVFKKFAKGDTSVNGTGLGLYIVKELTGRLNGEVSFESRPMVGTTFTIILPLITSLWQQEGEA
jgi:PAS domain S-box-containing protein